MKKRIAIFLIILFLGFAAWAGIFYWINFRGVGPTIKEPSQNIAEIINTTDMPFVLPDGFSISIFAKNLPGARVLARDALGNFWVSQTKQGVVSLLEIQDNKIISQNAVLRNLNNPHGLAFDPKDPFLLYVAEENKISKVRVYSDGLIEKIIDLPSGGNHFTRTIKFGPDERLYISIGSSCNVCVEKDARRAAIYSMEKDGGDFKPFATGLRNTVFFVWNYVDGKMWGTDMGRDFLGDDLPPDEINVIEEGGNYGWPICYGKNIHDADFDKNIYVRNPCEEPFEKPSYIDIPAHSAPLGLAFVPEDGPDTKVGINWPEEYWHDLFVAYHGSWNRSEPTGYKIIRHKLDALGNYSGVEDFITGWLTENNGALGRPVDILIRPGGVMYVTDDRAGVIYKITYLSLDQNYDDEGF